MKLGEDKNGVEGDFDFFKLKLDGDRYGWMKLGEDRNGVEGDFEFFK